MQKTKKTLEKIYHYMKRENTSNRDLIYELQQRLVQTCLDFINEKQIGDLCRIEFNADDLQRSADCGSWQPCTDSWCEFFNNQNESIGYSA